MSEPVTLKQQVAFMANTVETCETSYPIKVEMGRMTRAESERGLSKMRAILATLKKAEVAGVAESGATKSALSELAPTPKVGADKLAQLQAAFEAIHKCAREHSDECPHCRSIANLLGEMGSVV